MILSPFYSPNVGGVETHLDDLSAYLSKRGRQVLVLTFTPLTVRAKAALSEKRGRVEISRVPWIGGNLFHKLEKYPLLEFLYLTPLLFASGFFYLLKNSRRVHVIHAHGFNAAFAAKFLAKIFGKRCVASTHAIYGLKKGALLSRLLKFTLESFDCVLALSRPSARELLGIGVPAQKLKVYTYWVNQKAFSPRSRKECRLSLGLPENAFVVLFVGRLIEKKGAGLLLKLAEEMPNVVFAFAGTGPMEEGLESASKRLKNVVFFGKVENTRLPQYYCSADILAVPSLYSEGFGRVILEALSCGIPVIGSRKGAIPDAIGPCGAVVEPSAKGFKQALRKFYLRRKKLKGISAECRAFALKNYSEKNAKLIEDSYGF